MTGLGVPLAVGLAVGVGDVAGVGVGCFAVRRVTATLRASRPTRVVIATMTRPARDHLSRMASLLPLELFA